MDLKSRATLTTFISLLLFSVVFALKVVTYYLLAVAMGGIIALLFYGPFLALKRRGVFPKLASLFVTLGVVFLILAPICVFSFIAIKQGVALGEEITGKGSLSFSLFLDRLKHFQFFHRSLSESDFIIRQSENWIQNIGKALTQIVIGLASDLPQIFLQLALSAISCFFFLLDGQKLKAWLADKIPLEVEVREGLIQSFQNAAVSVIWATIAAALTQAGIMLFAFLALDVPAPFLATGLTFLLAWIPMIGSAPIWLMGALYLYSQDTLVKAALMIGLGLITGVADNLVRPAILKGSSQIHPLVSLIAIFGGVEMFGIVGVFLGPIVIAIALSFLEVWPDVANRFGIISKSNRVTHTPFKKVS